MCFKILPNVFALNRVVVNFLGTPLEEVHVELLGRGLLHGLELDVVLLVGIHVLADDDAADFTLKLAGPFMKPLLRMCLSISSLAPWSPVSGSHPTGELGLLSLAPPSVPLYQMVPPMRMSRGIPMAGRALGLSPK